jgi:hypothetical protein
MEEIREHFGYSVDPKTEKFQEMLAQKEAEEKKLEKEKKRKERQAKQMAKLLTYTDATAAAGDAKASSAGDGQASKNKAAAQSSS